MRLRARHRTTGAPANAGGGDDAGRDAATAGYVADFERLYPCLRRAGSGPRPPKRRVLAAYIAARQALDRLTVG